MSILFISKILLSILFITLNLATLFAIEGKQMNSQQKIVFNCPTASIEEFKTFAEQAKKLGATHVNISQIVPSRWQWELDRNDPYPNWGMPIATSFKIIVPPELQPYLPLDYGKKNFEAIKQRCAILKKLGLKAAFVGKEPAYLPEAVFLEHPDWRGPRCEHPRRARNAYYAPCIDQPKVLELYRNAVAELCRHAPIEVFHFLTNDFGGGICWSVSLYPGHNGPAWCEHRSCADRVVGFLSTIQEGAREAGLEAEVSFRYGSGYISRAEVESVIPYLKPGQSINGKNKDGITPSYAIGIVDYWSGVKPVIGIPQILKVAEQLEHIPHQHDINLNFSFLSVEDFLEQFDLIEQFNQNPFLTAVEKMQAVRQFAAKQFGEEHADLLMKVWEKIYKAVHEIVSLGPDTIMLVGTINQRWITRPLIPFPMVLTSE